MLSKLETEFVCVRAVTNHQSVLQNVGELLLLCVCFRCVCVCLISLPHTTVLIGLFSSQIRSMHANVFNLCNGTQG